MDKGKEKKKNETVKFNVSMKKSFFDMLETYADEMGVSRSAFITFCVFQYSQQKRSIDGLEFARQLHEDFPSNAVSDDEVSRLREVLGK